MQTCSSLWIWILCIKHEVSTKIVKVYIIDFNMDFTCEFEVGSSSNNENSSKRKAKEPDMHAKREKKCNQCGNSNVVYKFLNAL